MVPDAAQYKALLDELRSMLTEGRGEAFVTLGAGTCNAAVQRV